MTIIEVALLIQAFSLLALAGTTAWIQRGMRTSLRRLRKQQDRQAVSVTELRRDVWKIKLDLGGVSATGEGTRNQIPRLRASLESLDAKLAGVQAAIRRPLRETPAAQPAPIESA